MLGAVIAFGLMVLFLKLLHGAVLLGDPSTRSVLFALAPAIVGTFGRPLPTDNVGPQPQRSRASSRDLRATTA